MMDFASEWDENASRTLATLVKYNNGLFKSEKQAAFILKTFPRDAGGKWSQELADSALRYYGVELPEGTVMTRIEALMRWTDYGVRSVRPVSWIYVMDSIGIVAQYKLGYVGDMRQGTSPDPSKTKLLFSRDTPVSPITDKPVVKAESTSNHIGSVGSRITIKAKIVMVKEFEGQKFHYYDSGLRTLTRLVSEGNDIVYFGYLGDKGAEIEMKCTIKEHSVYNGAKQTVISRPKVLDLATTAITE
jgi:hypothetical protein